MSIAAIIRWVCARLIALLRRLSFCLPSRRNPRTRRRKSMDARQLYRDYLKDIKLMQLATCRDSQPWLCHVWYVMDEEAGKIYFISRETRRHSQEIQGNEKVACTFHKWFGEGLG